jgi:hypothetical protein
MSSRSYPSHGYPNHAVNSAALLQKLLHHETRIYGSEATILSAITNTFSLQAVHPLAETDTLSNVSGVASAPK